jgi:AbiV family abortive infection protein
MPSIEHTNNVVQSCVRNAEELIRGARAALAACAYGAAYHLAALSLEEVGKAALVLVATTSNDENSNRRTALMASDLPAKL